MPSLPKRPGPYITFLLVAVLIILAAWLHHALNSPSLQEAVRKYKQKTSLQPRDVP